ncbi:MAG: class I mannose-6-phosphate isomerase [Oscillospiraceae bacterium]|nr:class I mannose-6-phosphate isomerase [Oscillospiraceae bacterium]
MEPLKLQSALQDYIWGGTRLRDEFGKESSKARIAESWELSCHPAGPAVIVNSVYKGMTLKEYLEQDWSARVGEGAASFSSFPVLIKLIDANLDLSVQVHPDDRYARENENGESGKTECWYVVDCEEGAALAYGLNRELTKDEFRAHILDGTLLDYVRLVPVHKGDVFFIEPGTLHAIGAGILIAEIQSNSNITYRIYDYERTDENGISRELNIEKAVAVTKTWSAPPRMKRPPMQQDGFSSTVIADCPNFTSWEYHVTEHADFPPSEGLSYTHLLVTDGEAALVYDEGVTMPLRKGDSVFLPANFGAYSVRSRGCTFISTRTLPRM